MSATLFAGFFHPVSERLPGRVLSPLRMVIVSPDGVTINGGTESTAPPYSFQIQTWNVLLRDFADASFSFVIYRHAPESP